MKLNYSTFLEYISADLKVRKRNIAISSFIIDPISRFHLYMRLLELLQERLLFKPLFLLIKFLFLRLSVRLGFSIPINTLGKGVYLPHYGTIIINRKARVGDFSIINVDVVIGRHPISKEKVPNIGKNVYIGPGVKIFGPVVVTNNCVIGANSVVTKSLDKEMIYFGVPAKAVCGVSAELRNKLTLC